MDMFRSMSRALVVAVLSLSLSGCFLDFGQNYGTGIPGGNTSGVVDLDLTNGPCDVFPEQKVECLFKYLSLVIRAQAQFAGIAQLQYWLDPIIVQVPVDTSNVSGTFSGPANGSLSFTTVTGPLQADATRQIIPEAGMKFLIIDFPGGIPPGGAGKYHFTFNYTVPTPVTPPLRFKVLFAAKITVGAQTYYPPLFPCTTNMADVPAIALPANMIFTPIDLTPFMTQKGCSNVVYSFTPPAASEVTVVEYHHSGFDHYFMTPKVLEIDLLDKHTPPFELWSRTGHSFKAYSNANAPAGSVAICRFFNDSFAPKSSHFYALLGLDCETTLTHYPDWKLEDDKLFNAVLPDSTGVCPAGTVPLRRLYNHGMGAAPNHRFVTTLAEEQVMVAKGYDVEGVKMCVPS